MATPSAARPGSLRRRSFRDAALLAGATWLLLTAGLLALVRVESHRMFDDSLRERAEVVLAFSQHELEEMAGSGDVHDEQIEDTHGGSLMYQVWRADGQLAFRSRSAPAQRLLPAGAAGFRDVALEHRTLRGYAAWNPDHSFQVQMAEVPQDREAFVLRVSLLVALAMAASLAVFLHRFGRRLRQAFSSLDDTAAELAAAPAGHIALLSTEGKPDELLPMLAAFNDMAARVQRALQHEQRFTSDAAHEMKTPLASLKILLRNLERAGDPAEQAQALQRMHEVVDRSTALVDQLLALARYDREPSAFDLGQALDLQALCGAVLHELQPQAEAREIGLALDGAAAMPAVRGNPEALRTLVRNLVDNGLRYTPRGGRVVLSLAPDVTGDGLRLAVHDSGPGVPEPVRARLFGRFVRGPRQEVPGTGLGLAISERIVHLHGGRIELGHSPLLGGTLVTVQLPAA